VPHAVGHSPLEPHGAIGIRAMRAEGGWGIVAMQLCDIDPTADISTSPVGKMWDEGDNRTHAGRTEALHEPGLRRPLDELEGEPDQPEIRTDPGRPFDRPVWRECQKLSKSGALRRGKGPGDRDHPARSGKGGMGPGIGTV